MKIIEGFAPAKAALDRTAFLESFDVSPVLKKRLKEMFGTEEPEQAVRQIISEVKRRGDAALLDYALKIDRVKLTSLEVDKSQLTEACQKVDASLVSALKIAAERIRDFHLMQKNNIYRELSGGGLGQMVRPLQRVGVYAPGGTAWYPSTVLMTAIPARVAGVGEVILVTPPGPDGTIPAPTLVAADIAGVDRVFAVGGAPAIAALAFGTPSIPKVDKICGPGNIFVVLAKKLVYGAVAIDGLQGPSEIVIIADDTAKPQYCAADLLAQAEHDPLASPIMITTSRRLADEVSREVEQQLAGLKRKNIAVESLKRGVIAVVASVAEAIELANRFAPEHLSLMINNADAYVKQINNAGCVFVGETSPVVIGDYVAGPSHVLPTSGTARFSSPLNVTDFMKFINWVKIDATDLKKLGPIAITIARNEGLEAHARAVEKRLEELR